jgi:hypothetical protein
MDVLGRAVWRRDLHGNPYLVGTIPASLGALSSLQQLCVACAQQHTDV